MTKFVFQNNTIKKLKLDNTNSGSVPVDLDL